MTAPALLIVDDEKNTREALKKLLSPDFDVSIAANLGEAQHYIQRQPFRVILTDLRLGGDTSGLDMVQLAISKAINCVVMTAFGDVETAVTAMKNGAFDFVTKPLNLQRLKITLKQATAGHNRPIQSLHAPRFPREQRMIFSENSPFKRALDDAIKIADNNANILLFGETGTGKEVLAQAIHHSSRRKDHPLMAVHCASLSSTLLESELFGHERGAFTGATARHIGRFESANGGTLFLDEIGEIDSSTQVKLLRFLETKTFERVGGTEPIRIDVRIISATNKNLWQMTREGTFREDLYFRLNVIELKVPPLRDRREDIPLLFRHYIDFFCRENSREKELTVLPGVVEKLVRYPWPGNIRELRNSCESVVALLPKDRSHITADDLGEKFS